MKQLCTIIATVVFFFFTAFSINKSMCRSKQIYEGKMDFYLSYDGFKALFPAFAKEDRYFLYDNFLFEKYVKETNFYDGTWDTVTNTLTDRSLRYSYISVLNYYLTDLNNQITYEFDSSSVYIKLLRSFPAVQKNKGFPLFNDKPAYSNYNMDDWTFVKDTVINAQKYKIVLDKKPKEYSGVLYNTRMYINMDLKDFPLTFFNENLDRKYGGKSMMAETFNDELQIFTLSGYKFTSGLTASEKDLIRRFIAVAKQYTF